MAICPNGHGNPEGAKFCGECGLPLSGTSQASEPTQEQEQAPPAAAEDRPVGDGSGSQPVASPARAKPWHRRPVLLAGVLVAIIVAAIVVAAVALRDGDNGTVRAGNGESDVVTTSRRSSTTTTTEPRSERRDIEILKQGFSVFQPEFSTVPQGSYAVVFTNPNSTGWIAMSVSVNASFFDEADVVVKTEANNIAAILPGQSAAIGTSVYDMPPTVARMEVQARVGRWEETEETTGSFSFEGVSTSEEQFSGLRTNATLVSTFARDLEDIQVVAVYLTSDGQVVGGDFTFADFVPTGGTIGVEVSAFGGVPNVAAAELYANLSSLGLL